MDSEFGAIKAEAISRLQAALVSGNAVSEAIRWAFYRNPLFMYVLFAAAIEDRFGSGADVAEISAFVGRAGAMAGGDADVGDQLQG